jgi:hypothetical protein
MANAAPPNAASRLVTLLQETASAVPNGHRQSSGVVS